MEPRLVLPTFGPALVTQDSGQGNPLYNLEIRAVDTDVEKREQIRTAIKQFGLHLPYGNLGNTAILPDGLCSHHSCRLTELEDHRLETCAAVDDIGHGNGFLYHQHVIVHARHHHPYRKTVGRDRMEIQVRKALPAAVPCVMMVHRIIPYCYGRTVKPVRLVVRRHQIVQVEPYLTVNPPRFPVIRIERKPVDCRIFRGDTEILHPKFVLHEIKEPYASLLGFTECAVTLLRSHLYSVAIEIVTLQRPVDHIFPVRQFAVGNHILRPPHTIFLFRMLAHRIGTAAGKFRHVVIVRLGNRHRMVVLLKNHHVSKVLNDAVGKFRSNIFTRETV